MSALGSLAILVPQAAPPTPSSSGDKGDIKTNAAFAGVLDRVTAAKNPADPVDADEDAPLPKGGGGFGDAKPAKDTATVSRKTKTVDDSELTTATQPVLTDVSALVQAVWLASARPAAPTAAPEQPADSRPASMTQGATPSGATPPTVLTPALTAAKGEVPAAVTANPAPPATSATPSTLQAGAKQAATLPDAATTPVPAPPKAAVSPPADSADASRNSAPDAAKQPKARPAATVTPATVAPDRQPVLATAPITSPPKHQDAGPTAGSAATAEPPTLSSLLSSASRSQSDGSGSQNGSGGERRSPLTTDGTASTEKTARTDEALPAATPGEQVANALRPFLATESPASADAIMARTAADPSAATGDPSRPEPLKSLTIQLNPEHLGPVSITMRLRGSAGMQVHIAAANPQALQLLDRDRHLLSAVVEAAGGSKDALLIAAAAPSPGGGDMGSAGQSQSQSQSQNSRQDAFAPGASSSGGQARDQGRSTSQTSISNETDDRSSLPSPQARPYMDDSLYL